MSQRTGCRYRNHQVRSHNVEFSCGILQLVNCGILEPSAVTTCYKPKGDIEMETINSKEHKIKECSAIVFDAENKMYCLRLMNTHGKTYEEQKLQREIYDLADSELRAARKNLEVAKSL